MKNISEMLGDMNIDGVKNRLKELQTLGIIRKSGGEFGGSWVTEKFLD